MTNEELIVKLDKMSEELTEYCDAHLCNNCVFNIQHSPLCLLRYMENVRREVRRNHG